MTLLAHWHTLGWVGLVVAAAVALQVFLPGVLPAVLRWVIGTQWGRMLILTAVALAAMQWYGDARFSAGRNDVLAKQAQAADRARVDAAVSALNGYMAGAQAVATIDSNLERKHADAIAAKDHLIAGLQRGDVRLQHRFTCPAANGQAPAAVSAGDGQAEAGFTRADAAVAFGIAADGDAAIDDLTACQATVDLYQRIGVLKP